MPGLLNVSSSKEGKEKQNEAESEGKEAAGTAHYITT